MTLVDFLLARTADTIADCREVQALAVSRGIQPDDPREPSLRVARTLLAECEAVRRIVERVQYDFTPQTDGWHTAQKILSDLALPFAAHPDYRDEWKP